MGINLTEFLGRLYEFMHIKHLDSTWDTALRRS